MSKKLTVFFMGLLLLVAAVVPQAGLAQSLFAVTVTINGEEYEIQNESNEFVFNVDEFVNAFGLEETDKVEKISIHTPDGVKEITFDFLTLGYVLPERTINVVDNKAEYVLADVLGDLDKGNDGVSIANLRQLLYPLNYQADFQATVTYVDGTTEMVFVTVTTDQVVDLPVNEKVQLSDVTFVTDAGDIKASKLGVNNFVIDLAGVNGKTKVKAIKFGSDNAETLSVFSNESFLYSDATDLKFVEKTATYDASKLNLADIPENIIGEAPDYLFTVQELRSLVYNLYQNQFNGVVTDAEGVESAFNVSVNVDGWKKAGSWFFFDINGEKVKGWLEVDGEWYYLDQTTGAMKTGWVKSGQNWYYLDLYSGKMKTGWLKDGKKWYYLDAESGKMVKGWKEVNGKWFLLADGGEMVTGWVKQGTKWYFLNNYGVMATGWVKDAGKWYLLADSGSMKSGWVQSGSNWYFLASSGEMKTGWVKSGSQWYFLDATYGSMKTGWVKSGSDWYYLANSGAMKTGWVKVSNKWYYLYSSGKMAKNTTINGYKLGSSGAWIK